MSAPPEWITITIRLHPEMADVAANFCHEHGARGVMIDDDDPRAVIITAYFAKEGSLAVQAELTDYLSRLTDLFIGVSEPIVEVAPLKHENWAVAWKDNFQSLPIGETLMVTPPWLRPDPAGRHVIVIDPAEAFGTGTHETTQGCLELLEQAMKRLKALGPEVSVLDVGCGSGILGIAAVRLSATEVLGVDNDPVAVESARHNAALNGVQDRIEFRQIDLSDPLEPADIITANLDSRTLLANSDRLTRLTKGLLIISGVPLDQWDEVREAFVRTGLLFIDELTRVEWGAGLFASRARKLLRS